MSFLILSESPLNIIPFLTKSYLANFFSSDFIIFNRSVTIRREGSSMNISRTRTAEARLNRMFLEKN